MVYNLETFIQPQQNRTAFIQNYLNEAGLDAPIIQLRGKNHIYVKFPLNQYNSMFRVKTVVAHYDRAAGSPGANDNSAAVFSILQWAARLNAACSGTNPTVQKMPFHNIRIIFTDGEEDGEAGVKDQGAFALAELFRKLNIINDDIFVFDCMGRGTVPVICENNLPVAASSLVKNRVVELENIAEKLIKSASGGRWFKMPTSYSDNASFLANGIPAVAITMLPAEEINQYVKDKTPPATWSLFHTQKDDLQSLSPEAFQITANILDNLAKYKRMASC